MHTLHVPYNGEEIKHAYISEHNLMHKNQVLLLMITNNEKWHYLAVKILPVLFCKMTSKPNIDFY